MLVVQHIYAGSSQENFLRANKYFNKQEYTKALDLYDSISNKGSATWYNMGNCAYKLSKYKDAYVYWRKAQTHANKKEREAILYNIDILSSSIDVNGVQEQETTFFKPK